MSHTKERIEIVKLLQVLRRRNEAPGDTILRVLRRAAIAKAEGK